MQRVSSVQKLGFGKTPSGQSSLATALRDTRWCSRVASLGADGVGITILEQAVGQAASWLVGQTAANGRFDALQSGVDRRIELYGCTAALCDSQRLPAVH